MDSPFIQYQIFNLIKKDFDFFRSQNPTTQEGELEYLTLFTMHFSDKIEKMLGDSCLVLIKMPDQNQSYNELDNMLKLKGTRLKLIAKDSLLYTRYVWKRRLNMKLGENDSVLSELVINEITEHVDIPFIDEILLFKDLNSNSYEDVMFNYEKKEYKAKLFIDYVISKII